MSPITGRDAEFKETITFFYKKRLHRMPDPAGLEAWLGQLRNGMTGEQLDQALAESPEGQAIASAPIPAEPSRPSRKLFDLTRSGGRGLDFVGDQNQRMVLNGCDGFMDFRIYKDGGETALAPFLQESNELGFQCRRVFMQGSIAQNQVMQLDPREPGYYDLIRPFVEYENSNGIIPLLTIGIDNQDIQSPISHWSEVCSRVEGLSVVISFFNEWTKNKSDFGPGDIPPPGGNLLWSRGSDQGDGKPFRPSGPVIEFHPVRNFTTSLRDTIASPVELYYVDRYDGLLFIDEPAKMGVNASDVEWLVPENSFRFGRCYSAMCACAIFHNWPGQRGRLMDPLTRACAAAWTRGMRVCD